MSYSIKLQGFDSLKISDTIKLPNIAELISSPIIVDWDVDSAYKYGGELVRYLLSKTPLRNDKKYINVVSTIQYLTPTTASIPHTDWHCDPGVAAPFLHDANLHILSSSDSLLSSTTCFFDKGVDFNVDDYYLTAKHREFREHLTANFDKLNVESVSAPQDKMVTFTNLHAHRAINPTKTELRYFWRVQESDIEPSKACDHGVYPRKSVVVRLTDNKSIPSIEQHEKWTIVRDQINDY